MITCRGWGLWVMFIGLFPFIFTVPAALPDAMVEPGGEPASITGYFVFPFLISAGINFALDRFLERTRGDRRHDFMDITVHTWTFVFLGIAGVIAVIWLLEKAGVW